MSIHKFMTQISDSNYNFKSVLQIQTCDYNEFSNNGHTVSGSFPGGVLADASKLGTAIRNDGENYSWMSNFSTMIYDDGDTNSYSTTSNLRKCCNLLNSLIVKRGETRIIWFGKIDSTLTKHVPRIEIRESTGTYTTYYIRYLIDNVEYYSISMVAEFGAKYLPWRGFDKLISLGNIIYIWSQSEPDPVTHQVTLSTQLSVWSGSRSDITESGHNWFDIVEEKDLYDDDNPYDEGGTSGESDSKGNFSEDSDTVNEDELPDIDAVGTGFATIFKPSKAQLKNLATIMWNGNVFAALQNLVENIHDLFTSLAIVPFDIDAGSTVEVTWLGIPATSVYLTLAAKQYYELDMGYINLADDSRIFTSGSALDYSPFSKLGIFLPFIGFQELDIDECRGATIGLKYRIDILSGTCVALISIGGNTIYQFSGNCLSQIPITNESMQSLVTDAVNVGISAAAAHSAQGAASADMTAAEGAKTDALKDAKIAHAEAHIAQSRRDLISATANAAMGMKPTFGKAGSISASASLLAVKQPYLFLTTPRQSMPLHYQKYCGFPSNITGKLNQFSGFTVVENIRLNNLVATSAEVSEIYQLLKSGVII